MNQIVLLGRFTKDPVVSDRKTSKGDCICRFSLAVKKFGKKGDDDTMFVNCVAFGKNADLIVGSVRKGHRLLVRGSLDIYGYEKEGKREQAVEVVVDGFDYIETRDSQESEPRPAFRAPDSSVRGVTSQATRPFSQRQSAPPKQAVQQTVEEEWAMTDDDTVPF